MLLPLLRSQSDQGKLSRQTIFHPKTHTSVTVSDQWKIVKQDFTRHHPRQPGVRYPSKTRIRCRCQQQVERPRHVQPLFQMLTKLHADLECAVHQAMKLEVDHGFDQFDHTWQIVRQGFVDVGLRPVPFGHKISTEYEIERRRPSDDAQSVHVMCGMLCTRKDGHIMRMRPAHIGQIEYMQPVEDQEIVEGAEMGMKMRRRCI